MRSWNRKLACSVVALATMIAAMVGWTLPASAQGETFEVVSVDTTGCASGEFGMTVERANLDGGTYTVRTVVTVGDLVYMNENASISINGLSGWNIFDNFTYGPVPNPGTYPIPPDEEMEIDFTLERPIGTVLYAWTLVVDGCNTGNIIYNGAASGFPTTTTTSTTSTTAPPSTAPETTATAPPADDVAPAAATRPRFTG